MAHTPTVSVFQKLLPPCQVLSPATPTPHSLVEICLWHEFFQPEIGSPPSLWGPQPGVCTVGVAQVEGGGNRQGRQVSGSCLQCLGHPENKGHSQAGGGRQAVGCPQGPLAPAAGCLSLCQGPVGHTWASGLGRGGNLMGAPPWTAPPGDSAPHQASPGGQWWLVEPGGPPGRYELQSELGPKEELSEPQFPHLDNRCENLTAKSVDGKCHLWD